MADSRLRLGFLRALVFVPALAFVNDMIVGVKAVSGDTLLGPVRTKCGGVEVGSGAEPVARSWVVTNKMSPRIHNGELEQGDLVVVCDPFNPKRHLVLQIKRCGKEWVRVQDGRHDAYHVYIQEGYCWLEGRGDERDYDSRTFGPVSMGLIIGLPMAVLFPKFGVFTPPAAATKTKTKD